ncbi:Fibrocystin [Chelonia mydas]|uniref:Fibrocystin n=1 Tax=Chelonia mydas TaxID=8469 RepID=M7B7U0_CHEMY|nr:Fibrocystin [Chelonia mydas]
MGIDECRQFNSKGEVIGGKLLLAGPGPIEIHAHYILVSDGGKFQVGSPDKPLRDKAHIHLYGSFHSATFFPYGAKFLAVRNGTISMHGGDPTTIPPLSVDTCKEGVSRCTEEHFVDEEEEENAQQASGESVLPGSQDLFITLEPIRSQGGIPDPEAGEGTSGECRFVTTVQGLKAIVFMVTWLK